MPSMPKAPRTLLQPAQARVPLVHISTDYVVGGEKNGAYCFQIADLVDAIQADWLGAGYLAALAAGVYPALDRFTDDWRFERRYARSTQKFTPANSPAGTAR